MHMYDRYHHPWPDPCVIDETLSWKGRWLRLLLNERSRPSRGSSADGNREWACKLSPTTLQVGKFWDPTWEFEVKILHSEMYKRWYIIMNIVVSVMFESKWSVYKYTLMTRKSIDGSFFGKEKGEEEISIVSSFISSSVVRSISLDENRKYTYVSFISSLVSRYKSSRRIVDHRLACAFMTSHIFPRLSFVRKRPTRSPPTIRSPVTILT